MEIMPVAITSAKYPGNRSATACKIMFGPAGRVASFMGAFGSRFFVTPLAVELKTNDARHDLPPSGPRCE